MAACRGDDEYISYIEKQLEELKTKFLQLETENMELKLQLDTSYKKLQKQYDDLYIYINANIKRDARPLYPSEK